MPDGPALSSATFGGTARELPGSSLGFGFERPAPGGSGPDERFR
jgi:hypothetical protein